MSRFSAVRIGTGVAAASVLLLGSAVIGAGSASGTSTPKLTVAPSTNLRNGQTVKVSGTGYKPKDTVYIVECLRRAKGSAQCNIPTTMPISVTISSKGTFPPTKFEVITGKIGSGTCGTKASNLNSCDVSVGNASGGDSATFPISLLLKK